MQGTHTHTVNPKHRAKIVPSLPIKMLASGLTRHMPSIRHPVSTQEPGTTSEEVLGEAPKPGVMKSTKAQDMAIHAVSPLLRPSILSIRLLLPLAEVSAVCRLPQGASEPKR